MISAKLWCQRPKWFQQEQVHCPNTPSLMAESPQLCKIMLVLNTTGKEVFWLLQKCSSWVKFIKTTSLVHRFVLSCRARKSSQNRCSGFISLNEINKAREFWLAQAQSEFMSKEFSELHAGKKEHRGSSLKSLNPFIDDQRLLKVGG